MKIYQLSFVFLVLLTASCTKTVTETVTKTVVEKEIVYLQKKNDTLLKVNLPTNDRDFYQFRILKNDTIFYAGKDTISRKPSFDKLDSIYNIKATFENIKVSIGGYYEYIQKAAIHNVTKTNDAGLKFDYIVKKLTQVYRDSVASGIARTKHHLQFFRPTNTSKPAYELNFYTDALQVYEDESLLLTTIFGCCTSLPEYELFDLRGNFIFKSNNLIKRIKTEYGSFLISLLKNEVFDAMTIVIQDKHKEKQYVSLSHEIHNYYFGQNFQLKIKNNKKTEKGDYDKPLESYHLKSLDDIEIWIPFGNKDTLKIPFKNEKAFGIDYPQIKVMLNGKK